MVLRPVRRLHDRRDADCGAPTRCGGRSARRPCSTRRVPEVPLVLLTTAAPAPGSAGDQAWRSLGWRRQRTARSGRSYDVVELDDADGRGPPVPATLAEGLRRPDDRPRSLARRTPVPDDRTTVTELATALGTLGLGDLTRTLARAARRSSTSRASHVGRTRGPARRRGASTPSSPPPSPTAGPSSTPRTPCGADRRAWWSGPAGAAPRATRSPRSTCASTTSTWSAASTCRATSPTRPRPVCSTGCWPRPVTWDADRLVRGGRARRTTAPCTTRAGAPPGSRDLPDDPGLARHRRTPDACAGPCRRGRIPAEAPGALPRAVRAGQRGVGAALARQRGPAAAPPSAWCGGCCASATPPTSCSAPTHAGRCACGWRARGTGARPTSSSASTSRPAASGQPQVNWSRHVRRHRRGDCASDRCRGHVEVRWSHGRFAQPPEAKVYLDTPVGRAPRVLPPRTRRPTSPSCGS